MSKETGVLDEKKVTTVKSSGKPMAFVTINKIKHVAFGKVVDQLAPLTQGQAVEYTTMPPDREGGSPSIIFIKAAGGTVMPQATPAQAAPYEAIKHPPTYQSTAKDDAILWQVAYKMASELSAGRTTDVPTIRTLAEQLHLAMRQSIEGVPASDPAITQNPL